jgi:hypothetical protein
MARGSKAGFHRDAGLCGGVTDGTRWGVTSVRRGSGRNRKVSAEAAEGGETEPRGGCRARGGVADGTRRGVTGRRRGHGANPEVSAGGAEWFRIGLEQGRDKRGVVLARDGRTPRVQRGASGMKTQAGSGMKGQAGMGDVFRGALDTVTVGSRAVPAPKRVKMEKSVGKSKIAGETTRCEPGRLAVPWQDARRLVPRATFQSSFAPLGLECRQMSMP